MDDAHTGTMVDLGVRFSQFSRFLKIAAKSEIAVLKPPAPGTLFPGNNNIPTFGNFLILGEFHSQQVPYKALAWIVVAADNARNSKIRIVIYNLQ